MWIEETERWDEDKCELQNWDDQGGGETAEVSCKCDSPGYVGVFFKSGGVWRELDEEPVWEKRMKFRYEGVFIS